MGPPPRFHPFYLPRTSGVDHQVGFLRQALSNSEPISENIHRLYAVTMKNLPIAIGFAIITASQLVVGTCLVVAVAKNKGRDKLEA